MAKLTASTSTTGEELAVICQSNCMSITTGYLDDFYVA
jgi:hypothetical protein